MLGGSSHNLRAQYTARNKAGSQEPLNTCILYDAGSFATDKCGNDAHDAAFTIDPPTYDQPVFATIMCSTECPFANGQQYTSDSGEVSSDLFYAEGVSC